MGYRQANMSRYGYGLEQTLLSSVAPSVSTCLAPAPTSCGNHDPATDGAGASLTARAHDPARGQRAGGEEPQDDAASMASCYAARTTELPQEVASEYSSYGSRPAAKSLCQSATPSRRPSEQWLEPAASLDVAAEAVGRSTRSQTGGLTTHGGSSQLASSFSACVYVFLRGFGSVVLLFFCL